LGDQVRVTQWPVLLTKMYPNPYFVNFSA
jgi:hypothetical protein